MIFELIVQQLVNGLTLGSTYALIALGYTMVYGIITLINFAHGEIYMVGAFVGLYLVTAMQWNLLAAMAGAMAFCMVMGIVIERVAYRPLRRSTRLSALISAIGVSIFLYSLMLLIRGAQPTRFPKIFPDRMLSLGVAEISLLQLFILAVSALLMIGLHYLVQKTRVGKAMRATSQDYDTAALMGIDVNQIISYTFAIGSSLAAAGGVLVGMYFNAVFPLMGYQAGLKAFAAAVLGGIGSIPGAMLGGVLLGVLEMLGVAIGLSSYRNAIAFTILILVLLIRPTGLMGRQIQRKV